MTSLSLHESETKNYVNPYEDLQSKARDYMLQMGFFYDGDFPQTKDNEIEKFDSEDDRNDKRSWLKCCYLEKIDGTPGLRITFGRHDGVTDKISVEFCIEDNSYLTLTEEEKKKFRERSQEQRKKAAEEARKNKLIADRLADESIEIFSKLNEKPEKNEVTYFSKKGIENPYDTSILRWRKHVDKFSERDQNVWVAVVALRNVQEQIRALQELWPEKRCFKEGEKLRDKHFIGKTSGTFATFGALENDREILVSEGVATALTLFKATKKTSVVALNKGNLEKVVEELKKKYPKASITICADNDHHKEPEGKGNPGVDAAKKVAEKFGCKLAIPQFSEDEKFKDKDQPRKDFDDLRQLHGNNIVKQQIESATISQCVSDDPIMVSPGKIHEAVDAAEKLIREKDLGIYQRKGQLVRIVAAGSKNKKTFKGRDPQTLILTEADATHLEEILTKEGKWSRLDIRTNKLRPIDCPPKVAQMLRSRMDWNIREIRGIIRCPTLRQDGSILQTPGYDEFSALYYYDDGIRIKTIPEKLTKEDALEAMEYIKIIYKQFPFDKESSLSVAISALFTAIIRKSINQSPAHGITAPKMGSGKSLLAEIVSMIVTGKRMTAMPQCDSDAEERKRLLAVLLEGDPIVCYDNIEEPFGSSALCSVLTQHEFKDRVLGATKSATAPTDTTFLITGNNLVFVGDISTRVILCTINPKVERPEERSFDLDIRSYISKNRGDLIRACLIVLKAYVDEGRPKQNLKPYGRFEEWSDWVRSALVWVGLADPCETRLMIEAEDPVRNNLISLMNAWFQVFDDLSVTSKEIINRANSEKEGENEAIDTLKDSLLSIASKGPNRDICPIKLGTFLNKNKERIENGLEIQQLKGPSNKSLWKIKKTVTC